jgi:hypothetical protein
MTFSFSNKQETPATDSLQSKQAEVKYVSAHKANFKNWRSNRMYRSVRYSQQPVFGISRIFSPVNLFALMFISFFLFSCSKQKDQIAGKEQKNAEQAKMEATLPGYSEENTERVSWDQLPAQLKNAVPLKSLKAGKEDQLGASLWSTYSYQMGPWGGWGGSPYSIYPPNGSRIYAIGISSGSLIDRIVIWYQTWDGTIYIGGDRGGYGGYFNIQFFSPGEHITAIGGRSGALVDRLTVYTNYKWFSYGGSGGSPFFAAVPPGYQILGFYGGSGIYIDRIGFWVYTL